MRLIHTINATVLVISTAGFGDMLNVPQDYPSIQQAIEVAEDRDEILVSAGTYAEHINFLGKRIELKSTDGPEFTSIDGQQQSPSLVMVNGGEQPGTLLSGFTIINGRTDVSDTGGGIDVGADSSLAVVNCVVRDCFSPHGGGINVHGSYQPGRTFTMQDCLFMDCASIHTAGLAWISGSQFGETRVERCRFVFGSSYNGAVCVTGPLDKLILTEVVFSDCVFEQNSASLYGALSVGGGAILQVERCLFRDNSGGSGGNAIAVNCFAVGGHIVVRKSVFLGNGEPTCRHNFSGKNSSALIEDSAFCSNAGVNMSGAWDTSNIMELGSCPSENDCDGDGEIDWIQCVFNPEIDSDGNLVPDCCEAGDPCGLCPADITDNGVVDAADLGILLAVWNTDGKTIPAADINGDGTVNAADLGILLGAWGSCQ